MSFFKCPECHGSEFVRRAGATQWECNNCDYRVPEAPPGAGGHPEFHKILDEFRALHVKKAADYGLGADVLANCRGSTEFGIPAWIGVVMRMNDKMTRLKSFAQKGSLANESVEDSLMDLGCYAIISLILYRKQSKSQEVAK